jgi:hypothetical protein
LARNHLQRLGHVLAQLGQLPAAFWTGAGRRDDDPLARQMRGQRSAHRLAPFEAFDRGGVRTRLCRGDQLILGRGRLQLLELQLHLIELAGALGRLAEPVTLGLGDLQLEMRDDRIGRRVVCPGCGELGLDLHPRGMGGRQRSAQRLDALGLGFRRGRHARDGITIRADCLVKK